MFFAANYSNPKNCMSSYRRRESPPVSRSRRSSPPRRSRSPRRRRESPDRRRDRSPPRRLDDRSRRDERRDDREYSRRRTFEDSPSTSRHHDGPVRGRQLREQEAIRKRPEETGLSFKTISKHPGSTTVWIGSVPDGVSEDDIFDDLSSYGNLEGFRLVPSRGFGYARFENESALRKFFDKIESSGGLIIGGKRARVDMCEHMPQLGHPYRPGPQPEGCATIFMGNLPETVEEDDIRGFFSDTSSSIVSINLKRSVHRGFAFAHIRFETPEICAIASRAAGGKLKQNRVRLDWASEKNKPTERAPSTSNNVVVAPTITAELRGVTPRMYIGGLNQSITEDDLRTYFSQFGTVVSLKLHRDKAGNQSFGYITFSEAGEAIKAIEVHVESGLVVNGVKIRADYARPDRHNPIPQPVGSVNGTHMPTRSPSPPTQPRMTPVSFNVPPEYVGMRTWDQAYKTSSTQPPNGISA
jgi:RNA recognition motif-containing protein